MSGQLAHVNIRPQANGNDRSLSGRNAGEPYFRYWLD
jgi:hypothetical protein